MNLISFFRIFASLALFNLCFMPSLVAQTWIDLEDGPTNLAQVAFVRDSSDTLHLVTRRDSNT